MTCRIVLTGAGGFVGARLTRLLESEGHSVHGVTRRLSVESSSDLAVVADLAKRNWSESLPARADVAIHLAQSADYANFPGGAQDMVAINIAATTELLDWALRAGVRHVIVASTGSVYAPSNGVLTETSDVRAGSMYGASKLAAEHIAQQYAALLPVTIVRPFTIYGAGQSRGVFRTILDKVRQGQEVSLAGGIGFQTMPINVADAARLLAKLVERPSQGLATFNLGGVAAVDLKMVANTIAEIGNWTPKVRTIEGEPLRLLADSSKLYEHLAARPEVSLQDGLIEMVERQGA